MNETYMPVPVWNNVTGWWEPVDFRQSQRVVNWPDGFDPRRLPVPDYHEGDHVQFVRDETCAREGTIRRVLLQGGNAQPVETQGGGITRWSFDASNIIYIVTARGHDHRIKTENILGSFVSLSHPFRVFPSQE